MLSGIHQEVSLQQDLVIQAVNAGKCMVMPHKIAYPLQHFFIQAAAFIKLPYQRRSCFLLLPSRGTAAFFSEQRTGNIMNYSSKFQRHQGSIIKAFRLSDCPRKSPDLQVPAHIRMAMPAGITFSAVLDILADYLVAHLHLRHRAADRDYLTLNQWSVADVDGDASQCGLAGSPTKVKAVQNIVFQAKEAKTLTASDADVESLIKELLEEKIIG